MNSSSQHPPAPSPPFVPPGFDPSMGAQPMTGGQPYPMQHYAQQPPPGYAPPGYAPYPMQAHYGAPLAPAFAPPINIVVQNSVHNENNGYHRHGGVVRVSNKSKGTAAVLAIFLGGFGVHKFYLGQAGMGVMYLLLSMTGLSWIFAWAEALGLLFMNEHAFDMKYNARLT